MKIFATAEEPKTMTGQGEADRIYGEIRKSFPKSYVDVGFTKSFGEWLVKVTFTLGRGPEDWANKIIHNDPLHHILFIRGFDKDLQTSKDVQSVSPVQSNFHVSSDDKLYVYKNLKTGIRKYSGSPEKVVAYLSKYFATLRQMVVDNLDRFVERDQQTARTVLGIK